MTAQLEILMPLTMDVCGTDLAETVLQLESDGVLISRMETGDTNGSWKLTLCWPQHQPNPLP